MYILTLIFVGELHCNINAMVLRDSMFWIRYLESLFWLNSSFVHLVNIIYLTTSNVLVSILAYIRVPAVLLNSIAVVATAISMGFYSATLEPHLRIVSPILFLCYSNTILWTSIWFNEFIFVRLKQWCTYWVLSQTLKGIL